MAGKEPVFFDLETVAFLREILDDAWACVPPQQQSTTDKSALAERLLKSAAQGERDPDRLIDAALSVLSV